MASGIASTVGENYKAQLGEIEFAIENAKTNGFMTEKFGEF